MQADQTFKNEVFGQLELMGFQKKIIEQAWSKSEIKTAEGLINYIEVHPELSSAMIVESQGEETPQEAPAENQEKPDESTKMQEENLVPISSHINSQFRDQLVGMGFSVNPAEKALFMTQNKSVQAALEYIQLHQNDADFNEQLFIVGNAPPKGAIGGDPSVSNLTPEEAKQKARELQKILGAKLKQKDKDLAVAQEKERLRAGKDMSIAKRKLEESQMRLHVDYLKREKKEKDKAMAEVLAQIEADKYARTGKRPVKKLKPVKVVLAEILRKMQRIYPAGSMASNGVKSCLKTCKIYLSKYLSNPLVNYLKNPELEKFQKINLENPAFQRRVGNIIGGNVILKEAGFVQEGTVFVMKNGTKTRIEEFAVELNRLVSLMK